MALCVGGCGDGGQSADGGAQDLSPAADLAGRDLAGHDLALLPDLAPPPDLLGADLAGVDLVVLPDLALVPDLATLPDLAGRDLAGGAPTILRSFDGDTGTAAGMTPTYRDHPDMSVSACSNCGAAGQVLEVTGQDVTVFDLTGKVLKQTATAAFLTAAGVTVGTVADPRSYYDPLIGRWIVACSCSTDFLLVSGSGDATGAWKGVALSGNSGDLTMRVGFDANGIYVSEYHAGDADAQNPQGVGYDFFAMPAADAKWSGGGNIVLTNLVRVHNKPFDAMPAIDLDPNKQPGDRAWFVARSGPIQNGANVAFNIVLNSVTWNGQAAAISADVTLPSGYLYNTPIDVSQPQAPMIRGTESHRFWSVFESAGQHLELVQSSGPCAANCGAQGSDKHDLLFWYDLDASGNAPAIAQSAKIADPQMDLLFASLAVDQAGSVGIAATGVSAAQPASVFLYSHAAGAAAGSVSGPITAHAGTQTYSCAKSPVGWGTYATSAVDGSDPTKLWAVAEYGGSATPCVWKTRIIQYAIP